MVEPYQWMVGDNLDEKLELMASIQTAINDLPRTALTFKPTTSRHIDPGGRYTFVKEVLECYGFWSVPSFNNNRTGTGYVNPDHEGAHLYTDVSVECRCGATVVHEHERHVTDEIPHRHEDHCRVEWEREAQAELWKSRREIIKDSAFKLVPLRTTAKRLGVSDRGVVYSFTKRLDLDYKGMKEEGTMKRWATWVYLRDKGFTNTAIAEAFNAAPNTISGAESRLEDADIEMEWREEKEPSQKPDWWLKAHAEGD